MPAAADGAALLAAAAAGTFPATLYVEGPDEALKAAFLAEYRRAWAAATPQAPAARVMLADEDGVDAILAAHHGLSMFAPRELTVVFGVEELTRSDKRVAALAQGAARPAGESRLVLVESAAEPPRRSLEPLRAACAARWQAEPLPPAALVAWGRRRLAAAGLAAEPGALEALLDACEGESAAFFNELGKLPASGAGGRVTRADVAALAPPAVGAALRAYLEAVAHGHAAAAAQRLGRLLAAGESEGSVMFALGNLAGGALGGWSFHRDLAQALGARRRPAALARALDAVYRAEAAWKSGRLDPLLALEQATREVAAG